MTAKTQCALPVCSQLRSVPRTPTPLQSHPPAPCFSPLLASPATQQLHRVEFQIVHAVNLKRKINLPHHHQRCPGFIPISTSTPTLRILLTICGVSMLQIFEPFSLCCRAYTDKIERAGELCHLTILFTFWAKITFS